jgi:hypothetical protein
LRVAIIEASRNLGTHIVVRDLEVCCALELQRRRRNNELLVEAAAEIHDTSAWLTIFARSAPRPVSIS